MSRAGIRRTARPLRLLVLLALGGCVVGGYDYGGAPAVGYDVGFYEPLGVGYGGWHPEYHVGPPRREEHPVRPELHAEHHAYRPAAPSRPMPSIPTRPRAERR